MTTTPTAIENDWDDEHRVAVIIVNYRTPQLTVACVQSIRQSTGVRPRIIVVDNASRDESTAHFQSAFADLPGVTLVARTVNDGYTGGNNAGVAVAMGMNARFAFILNSDTTVDPDCLRLLIDEAARDPRTALVSPRIFFGDAPDRIWFAGSRFSLWHGRPIHVAFRRPESEGWTDRRDLPFVSGCALLVDLGALDLNEPLFDASLFAYGEDLDLSLRVRHARRRIRFVPEARVLHFEGSSHRRAGGEALRFYLSTRNTLRVVTRHARWFHWPTLGPALAVDLIGRYCAVTVRDRDPAAFRAVLRGAWHALVGGRHAIEADVEVNHGPGDARPAATD
ncbi:MAG TPA: glycosyltransferase family 2 protein [Gemmatimonadaceae bacterium]|nr:glycosyltransferase family 2 protein [Gemmatimonadaceae bacterium]